MTAPHDAATDGLVARFDKPSGAMVANQAKLTFVVENRAAAPQEHRLDTVKFAIR